jgi:uncharacterized membrane protein YcaP (DUF421 family)
MSQTVYNLSVFAGKGIVVMAVISLLYRVLGKRFAGQMNLYDLAAIVAIANALQNALTEGKGDLSVGLVSSTVLICAGWLISMAFTRAPRLQKVLVGIPTLLIYEGHLLTEHLTREHVATEEVCAAMHEHGLQHFEEVGMAVLELDGSISIVPKGRSCKFDTDLV